MKKIVFTVFLAIMVSLLILAACSPAAAPQATPAPAKDGAGIANPASENCVKQGGNVSIVDGPKGQYGVCVFEDNLQCEEWALMNGDCPTGGVKITGYVTEAAVYCAITGGDYTVTGNSGEKDEQGTCAFKSGKSCDVWKYYRGECTP